MDFNGPPRWEHLLAAVRGNPLYYAGGFLWPVIEDLGRPNEERPEDNEVFINPLLHPEDQEEEEEMDVVGLDDDVVLERGGGDADVLAWFDRPDSRGGEEREDPPGRPPSAPPQQLPPPDLGMDWGQQAPPFYVPAYPVPPALPYAVAFPYAYPHAPPFAPPYAAPHAFPFIPPYAPPYAAPYAFPFIPLYAPPYAVPYAFPFIPPYAPPYAAPHAFPFIPPVAPPFAPPHADHLAFAPPPAPPNSAASEEPDSGIDSDSEGEDGYPGHFAFPPPAPLARPETLWPATLPPYHTDTEEEDQVVPLSCGLSPSTRRSREENDEEEAPAKRPRWSDGND